MKVSIVHRRDRYLRGGDHIPFLERGFAGLRVLLNQTKIIVTSIRICALNGVKFGDLPEFVDFAITAQVARINAAALSAFGFWTSGTE